ncbi:arginine--tRNA ligase [Aneurinibacillus aneurinilyticus]|uniref:arginine--tRNA ligase n=1 Tax=Aneurinibacillus aneurinilyticus TaxID=1391 RepID=UPI000422DE51|nr:arginine--tRNA ligase [Aneurinibacillus aneurinilyticus]MCI1696646.1 arginine--tRNA ligase [Aneurinibacillus aneurinilyticus]MED0668957.1 arginine--tRNA ligase [Aneurinibacillus aneurinilyticus]MED0707264.1 arginine--tRNA ligase [Aneurinibacillus aneurinilyticus]MED0726080.1 arginine--tRNA ligase [Aneurinibacillus aneurinilyticus]MED0733510.1 arginine--tRNA ligase [Aneurinibacillus aneurinilyticus]
MSVVEQTKSKIIEQIKQAVIAAGIVEAEQIPDFALELPKDKQHGDYATNVAMQLTRIARRNPRQIAEEIISGFDKQAASISKIEIAGPGFINFYMNNSYLTGVIAQVIEAGEAYGRTDSGKAKKVQVEFVSANPTGSLHLGHARGAAFGDALCNVLDMAGYDVSREYYINDAGNQIVNLARSLEARYFQALGQDMEMPEDGYYGQDIIEFGKELAEKDGDKYAKMSPEERFVFFRNWGRDKELEKIKIDLADFRVKFDEWFSETSLYETGAVEKIIETLREKGYVYDKDGATWLRSTDFGDDKDRVLIKQDGTYTYLTPDIAYHENKFSRGFEQLINIWGADHHGYIPRMKAAMQCLGHEAEQLVVLINQMVSLYQGGEKVKMSKRTGKAVTMRDLMEEVGTDATRYFFAMRSQDAHLDFDMDLAVSKSNENPVFYVQYAHARICSIFRQADEQGIALDMAKADFSRVGSEKEIDLLKHLGAFPEEVAGAAEVLAPHRVVRYVHELASLLHSFYNAERVITEDEGLTHARLALMKAVQITIVNALRLIGVSAPERM